MKKLFLVALAAVGMTACVQNEELVVPQNTAAITFADAYVSNATKADPTTTTASIEDFDVWAFMDEYTGVVLADEDVEKNGGVWSYDNTQYWFPNHTYYFAALSPMESANVSETLASGDDAKLGLGTVAFTNVDGTEDLLYAKAKVNTPDAATLANQGMDPVNMHFQHLLSKVKFTFLNGFTTNNVTVAVSNVKMVAPKSATINLAQADYSEAWVLGNETLDLEFGATEVLAATASGAAANERLTIPAAATQVYEVTFDVLVKVGDQEAMTEHKSAVIEGLALEMGKAYNFSAVIDQTTLGLHAIEFTATVEDWADGVATDVIKGKAISTAAELAEAVKTSGEYVLVNDIAVDADATMTVAAGNHVVLYLNGHTLTAESDETSSNRNVFDVRGGLVVKGGNETYTRNAAAGTIAYKHVGTNMGWNSSINIFNVTAGGVLELEGVTASVEGSDMAFVAHLNNWGKCTLNVNNCNLTSSYITVRVFNSGPDMNNVTIKNTTLKGKYCFWVHNYKLAGDSAGTDATLNLNIYNGGEQNSNNVFDYSSKAPVLFGFNNPIYYNEEGFIPVYETNAENKEVIVEQICVLDVDTVTDNNGQVETKYVYGVTGPNGLKWISNQLSNPQAAARTKTATATETPAYVVNGNTVKLLADIDLTGVTTTGDSFAPIGRYCSGQGVNAPFTGHFDGQGHTIKGIYQSGWDFGYEWGTTGYLGLFGYVKDATIENLTIEGMESVVEGGTLAAVAGRADGECVFKNITVKNCKLGTYNNRCGGIVGWTGGYYKDEAETEVACHFTFENIEICDDVVLGGLWGSFDSSIGGVMGQLNSAGSASFKNVTVSCRIDAYNDCTASYDYYLYRMCGMLIGQMTKTTQIDGSTYPDVAAYGITFDNVTVNYGKWMNYHYCEPTPGLNGGRGMRVEAGFTYDGLPADFDHTQCVDNHYNCIPFDQLFGGTQTACKGVKAWDGVTVNYPAEYTCTLCGKQHNVQ